MAAVRTTVRTVLSPLATLFTLVAALLTGGSLIALGQSQGAAQGRVSKPAPQTIHSLHLDFTGEQPRPLAMVSGDFDGDGTADLVVGYALGKGGSIQLLRGNPDALAPQSEETWQKIANGEHIDAFLQQSNPIKLQTAPSLLLAADVNGDGHLDLVYAGKGSSALQVMLGTGHGTFLPSTLSFNLPGPITALAAYRPGASVPGEAILVGYQTPQGGRVGIVSSGKAGLALNAQYALPGTPTMFAVAQLDSDLTPDVAIVAGGQLLVLHGYQAINGKGQIETLPVSGVEAVAPGAFLFDRHQTAQLSVLTANGELLILAHQGFDPRPYTREQLIQNRRDLQLHTKNALTLAKQAGDYGSAPWIEIERHSDPALYSSGPDKPVLLHARMSGSGGEDLVVLNSSQGQRVTISHNFLSGRTANSALAETDPARTSPSRVTVESLSSGGVVAALATRVSADGRPGLVMLHHGDPSPQITVPHANNTFYVTSTADGAPASPNGTLCGSPSAGGCTLRDAITFANADAADNASTGSDTIMVPAGTYTLTYLAGQKDGEDNLESHLELYGPVTIIGAGATSTIINANSNDMVFNVNPGPFGTYNGDAGFVTFDATLESMTLENGKNTNNPNASGATGDENNFGGCIFWTAYESGNLTLSSVNIQDCTILWGGGGAINAFGVTNSTTGADDAGSATLTLTGGTISGNSTSEQGGAIYIGFPPVGLSAANTTFSNNKASTSVNTSDGGGGDGEDDGGALYLTARPSGSSTPRTVLNGVTISGNTANGAGGGIDTTTGILLENSVVSGNTSVYASSAGQNANPDAYNGGGVWVEVASPEVAASITSTDLLNNSAYSSGGGVAQGPDAASAGDSLTISLSRIFGNTATANANSSGLAVGEPGEPAGTTNVGQVTATDNWWGCNSGPTTASDGCDQAAKFPAGDANGTMTVAPYAQLAISANTTAVTLGGSIDLTVSLNKDSNGNSITGAFPAVSGDSITYNVTGVTASPALTAGTFASNGTDTPTLTPSTSGNGSVAATFDNQTLTLNFTVGVPPAVTSASSTTFNVGVAGSFTVTTTGFPAPSLSESGALPSGVSFTDNGNGTATLAGTASAANSFPIVITANNGFAPNATQNFTLNVTIPQVQLTIAANPAAGGSVTPVSGGLYILGTVVPITATPNTGYTFLSWLSSPDAVASPTSASTNITMNAAETVTAQFAANLVVNTAADDNPGVAANCTAQATPGSNTIDAACSLRDALAFASSAGAANITFASAAGQAFATPQTITLGTAGTLNIPSNTTITGPTSGSGYTLANLVTVSGANTYGVFMLNSGVVSISGLTIASGNATYGGGIFNDGGTLTVTNSTFTNNASVQFGGGIISLGSLTVTNSTFTGNSSAYGGGILNYSGTVTVTNSTFTGNSAPNGGGIYNNASLTMTNSTLSGNTASAAGGGIYWGGSTNNLANSIISGNQAPSGPDSYSTYTDNGGNVVGSTGISLAPLGDYGGPEQTMVPLPGSPAICAGTLANATAAGLTTDQRGLPFDPYCAAGSVDSGAVQSNYAIAFYTMPSDVIVGQVVTPSPTVNLTESGMPATIPTTPVTLSDSNVTLNGPTTENLSSGTATFNNIVINTTVVNTHMMATMALTSSLNLTAQAGSALTVLPVQAALTAPAPNSVLAGLAVTFSWSASIGSTGYSLWVGSTGPGSSNVFDSGRTTLTSVKVVPLPTQGGTIYVRLYTHYFKVVQLTDYTFTASMRAALTSPPANSVLPGLTATFTWSAATGASGYSLWLGSTGVGSHDLYSSGSTTATSATAYGLPTNGETIYARINTIYNGVAVSNDYTYTAATLALAALTTPAPGSVLTGSKVTFQWSAATGGTGYSLWLGSTGPGSFNLFHSGATTALSATASGLPTNGSTIYARLYTYFNSVVRYTDYTYTAQ